MLKIVSVTTYKHFSQPKKYSKRMKDEKLPDIFYHNAGATEMNAV